MNDETPIRVVCVCLGNICRSPIAEALIRHHAASHRPPVHLEVRSAGTGGWHVGEGAHPPTVAVARRRGLDLSAHRARQFRAADLAEADWVLAMDGTNEVDIRRLAGPGARAHVARLLAFAQDDHGLQDVPDPYGGDTATFERVHDLVEDAAVGFVAHLARGRR